jgi:hypothetical protein
VSDFEKSMLSIDDFLWYLDQALDTMVEIVVDLGDVAINRRIDTPGSNSPYAVLTHCLGVIEFWGGHAIAGRTIQRDRASEFVATGSVEDILGKVERSREQIREDIKALEPGSPPRGALSQKDLDKPTGRTQGGVLMHIYEEISQHLGQMEVSRDVLKTKWVKRV